MSDLTPTPTPLPDRFVHTQVARLEGHPTPLPLPPPARRQSLQGSDPGATSEVEQLRAQLAAMSQKC